MASAKIYDSDRNIINVEYNEDEICKLRIGTDWYEKGVTTNDGRIISFDNNMPDGWAIQVGDYNTPGYEFYPNEKEQPFYPHSWSYAKEHGEQESFINIYSQNVDCRDAIDNAIRNSYDPIFGSMPKNAAKDVVYKYGADEVAYILGLTVSSGRVNDGRISMDNRFWSVECDSFFKDVNYYNEGGVDITLKSSSPALNKFITRFREETDFDPEMAILGTDKEPYPLDSVYAKSYDYALKNNEMPQYLWSWGLNCQCADVLDAFIADPMADNLSEIQTDFGRDRVNFVLASSLDLYVNNPVVPDACKNWIANTPIPDNSSVMERDGYLLRANADSLVDFLNENLPTLTNKPQERTEISLAESILLFNGPQPGTFTYGLYQIVDHDCPYYGKASVAVENFHPDPSDYTLVYSESVNGSVYNLHDTAEDIFEKFDPTNIDYPNDYFGREASISDVIIINDGYHYVNAFYADDFGFRDLPDFVNERRDLFLPPEKDKADNSENKLLEQQKNGTLPDPTSVPSGR